MTKERFVSLVVGLCEQRGTADFAQILRGEPLEADGVRFSLIHSEADPGLLLIHCDVGVPPVGSEAEVYAGLLLKNFYLSANRGPVFTLAPHSGRVLMVQSENLAEATAALVEERLAWLAQEARAWQEDPFPSEQELQPGVSTKRFARQLARR